MKSSFKEEKPSPPFINAVNRNNGGSDVNQTGNNRRHQSRVVTKPDRLKQHRRVEHDDVDPRELLERRDQNGHSKMRPVLPLQQVAPRMLHELRSFAGGDKVVHLVFDVVDASDLTEFRLGLLESASLDHGVRCVREDEGSDGDDESGNDGAAEAEPPAPAAGNLGEEEV